HDHHGIVTKGCGLLPPNHYLSACIHYLFSNRKDWRQNVEVGKTVVSSSMIDRVSARLSRALYEVPVGFKWFVEGLLSERLGFAGEESAGCSFLDRKDRKSTRLNSSHVAISYAVFCLKKKKRELSDLNTAN